MRRLGTSLLTLALSLSFTCVDVRAGGANRVGGIGPKDKAMGGSGIATADDAATFYYNPALLAGEGSFFQIGTDYIRASFDYATLSGRKYDSDTGQYFVPLAGMNYQPTQKLALGLGLTTPYVLGADFGKELGFYSKISLAEIAPAIAYRLTDNLFLGAALKIGYGQIELSQPIYYSGINLGRADTKGDGFGYGWQAGSLWKPTKRLSLGVSYQSIIEVALDGRLNTNTALGSSSDRIKADFSFPGRYGIGAGLELGNWLLTGNILRFDYSATDKVVIRFKNGTQQTLVLDWKDNWYGGGGVEYKLLKNWKVRAGAAYQSAAVPESTISPAMPDMDGWDVSGGLGYRGKRWAADISYQHAWGPERKVGPLNPGAGKYSAVLDLVSAAIAYRW